MNKITKHLSFMMMYLLKVYYVGQALKKNNNKTEKNITLKYVNSLLKKLLSSLETG